MNTNPTLLYSIFLLLFCYSCNVDEEKINNETKDNVSKVKSDSDQNDEESFNIRFTDLAIQRNEEVEIFLSIDDRNYSLGNIDGMGVDEIDKNDFAEFDIPSDAISAIQSFWTGIQTVLYIKDLDENVSVRKAEWIPGESGAIHYTEIFKVSKAENNNSNYKQGVYEFVECFSIGDEFIGLLFENDFEKLEILDAKESIWMMLDWCNESASGLMFNLEFDETNAYLSKCELIQNQNKHANQSNLNNDFYILNVKAIKDRDKAIEEVEKLKMEGYNANFLWIPDYNSLSKAEYFSVYIGPFYSQKDCEFAVEQYRTINPKAYGLLVSQENKRVQINGIDKISIKEPYH